MNKETLISKPLCEKELEVMSRSFLVNSPITQSEIAWELFHKHKASDNSNNKAINEYGEM